MGLAGYKPPYKEVKIPSEDGDYFVKVYGLSANAVSAIIQAEGQMVRSLYEKAMAGQINGDTVADFLDQLMDEAPIVAGLAIAFATGDPEEWETATQIPFGAQVEILEATMELTLQREGGVEKLWEIVKRAAGVAAAIPAPARKP